MSQRLTGHRQEFLTLRSGYIDAHCECGWHGRQGGYVVRFQAVYAHEVHKSEVKSLNDVVSL